MERLISRLDKTVSNVMNNQYVSAFITLFLILYSGFIAPELPSPIANLFNYTAVKVIGMFSILVALKYNTQVALFTAVAFVVTMMTSHRHQVFTVMANALNDVTEWSVEQAERVMPPHNGSKSVESGKNSNGEEEEEEEDDTDSVIESDVEVYPPPVRGATEWQRFYKHLDRHGMHPRPIHGAYETTYTGYYDSSGFEEPTKAGADLPEPQPESSDPVRPPSEYDDVHVGVFDEPTKGNYVDKYATIGTPSSQL